MSRQRFCRDGVDKSAGAEIIFFGFRNGGGFKSGQNVLHILRAEKMARQIVGKNIFADLFSDTVKAVFNGLAPDKKQSARPQSPIYFADDPPRLQIAEIMQG